MKKLIITASPSSTSFTHKIAEAYETGSKQVGDQAEIINLYDEKNFQSILHFEDKHNFDDDKNRKHFQEKITQADELVFIFPVWWGGVPGILKNFFDTNLESGFAFKYGKNGLEKLLVGKTVKVFCTCDAPGFLYKYSFLSGINLKKYMKNMIFGFCGMTLTHFSLFDKMRARDEANKKGLLEQVQNEAANQ